MPAVAVPARLPLPALPDPRESPPLNLPDAATRAAAFDCRPYGFTHRLHELELFQRDAIARLALSYAGHPRDYAVTAGATAPQQSFSSVQREEMAPHQALEELDRVPRRVLLKRPELHDARFAELLRALYLQVAEQHPQLPHQRLLRLESAIFISSGRTLTPFHFDAETAFLSQIEGQKQYHVYLPQSVSEPQLETFHSRGISGVGELDLQRCDAAHEYVFRLRPGHGLHQPHAAPHWVATGDGRSVSYTFVFETAASRRRCRARAFNHYLRRLGGTPSPIGAHPAADSAKAALMRPVLALRRG